VKDDSQLVDEAVRGDSAAFGQLVTRYQDRLYNTMLHVLGSAEMADDVAQDAFVQAYVKLETFERASGFYTWLYRIAFNLAISRRRRDKHCLSIEQARDASGHEPADTSAPPSARIEQAERAAHVRRGLAMLSDEHRAILILREVDGCSYDQIGQVLDLPSGTIRSRLHRARIQLRDQLKAIFQEETS